MIKNKVVSLIYKSVTALLCIWGLLLGAGVFSEKLNPNFLFYYTNQSNMLCLVSMVLSIITCIKSIKSTGVQGYSTFAPRFKGAVVLAITVTMLVYWAMLYQPGQTLSSSSILLHLVVPLLIILDWLLFDEKGKYKKADPVRWLMIPILYYIFANIVALVSTARFDGSYFPYFFLDYILLGVPMAIVYFICLALGFLLLGYVYYGLSQLLAKKQKSKIT